MPLDEKITLPEQGSEHEAIFLPNQTKYIYRLVATFGTLPKRKLQHLQPIVWI